MTFDFLWHCQISVLIAVAILEECCMASADSNGCFTQVSELGLLFPDVFEILQIIFR